MADRIAVSTISATILPTVIVATTFLATLFVDLNLPVSAKEAEAPRPQTSKKLLGHWPLAEDGRDASGNGRNLTPHGNVEWSLGGPHGDKSGAAKFNGRDARLVGPTGRELGIGAGDFSISLWAEAAESRDDVPGDLVSLYDPAARRGFHLALKQNAGVTFSQANHRQLQFGIDDNHAPAEWTDCGRPGNALLAFALAEYDGELYAGTCEPGRDESGRVYRYAGGQEWIDCGAPDKSNAVTAMAVYDGSLYVGTGKYRTGGSALPESENQTLGGRIFRLGDDGRWIACGSLPQAESVGGMVVYRGRLYASSLYKPAGFFRYEGGETWTDVGVPEEKRVEALGVYNGQLYATSYDEGSVFRYDGRQWEACGKLGDNTQTYAFAVHFGRLFVGTWRSGRVYRFEDVGRWTDDGRLGEELEVMGMLVHNGRLIAGTLPTAEVYERRDDAAEIDEGKMPVRDDRWRRLVRLDHTPDVMYRRAWTMCEHDGRVFCSTLPSGRIFSWQAGRLATWGREFPTGWRHVAAVKSGDRLTLYVDGQQVAESSRFGDLSFSLDVDQPLRVGFGANDFFHGRLADMRVFRGALSADEVRALKRASVENLPVGQASSASNTTDGLDAHPTAGKNSPAARLKAGESNADTAEAAPAPLRIVMVGDSTMASYPNPPADRPELTGWGQVFGEQFGDGVQVLNHARSGRSSKSFLAEGAWEKALGERPDYVFIQFGHNDQPGKGDRSTDPNGDFRDNLRRYVSDARDAGAIPVLVTPVARRTFTDGRATSTLGPFVEATLAVARDENVPAVDLHAASLAMFDRLGDEASADLSASASDRTHFSQKGARAIASLVADALPSALPDLAKRLAR